MTKTISVKRLGVAKLVDELGVLKATVAPYEVRAEEIKAELKKRSGLEKGDVSTFEFLGNLFRVTVEATVSVRLNTKKIKEDMDKKWLKKYTSESPMIKVVSRAHKKDATRLAA